MEIDPRWLLGVVVLTVLTVLVTGPGMWSEKWGWGWLDRSRRERKPKAPEKRE
jgi:hypothetical protein